MKDSPLFVGLLVGLIVVLVIIGVSFLVKMNSYSDSYKQELSKVMALQKRVDDLDRENKGLTEKNIELKSEVEGLNIKVKDLKLEVIKLEKLKEKLEENLKNELIKADLTGQPQAQDSATAKKTEVSADQAKKENKSKPAVVEQKE